MSSEHDGVLLALYGLSDCFITENKQIFNFFIR